MKLCSAGFDGKLLSTFAHIALVFAMVTDIG